MIRKQQGPDALPRGWSNRKKCRVKGVINIGTCESIGVGDEFLCEYRGECEHQADPEPVSDKALIEHLRSRPVSLNPSAFEAHIKIYDLAAAERIEQLLANVEVLSALVDEYQESIDAPVNSGLHCSPTN